MNFPDSFWLYLEYFGVASGLLYLWLEMTQRKAMWIVGGVCSLLYIFIFAVARIYADMAFNIYNVVMSIYGFIAWRKASLLSEASDKSAGVSKDEIHYIRLSPVSFLQILSSGVLIYGIIFTLLKMLTDSPVPAWDATTTTLSILATWMLTRRYIEQWLGWLLVNLISLYLYYLRGLYPTMGLYLFYTAASAAGYWMWLRKGVFERRA
jgi:nicotinamide mononucleotide transporter